MEKCLYPRRNKLKLNSSTSRTSVGNLDNHGSFWDTFSDEEEKETFFQDQNSKDSNKKAHDTFPESKLNVSSTSSKNDLNKKGVGEQDFFHPDEFDDEDMFDFSNPDDEYRDSQSKDSKVVKHESLDSSTAEKNLRIVSHVEAWHKVAKENFTSQGQEEMDTMIQVVNDKIALLFETLSSNSRFSRVE